MDKLDEALRGSIKKLWPIEGKKMHALLIPPNEGKSDSSSLKRRDLWSRTTYFDRSSSFLLGLWCAGDQNQRLLDTWQFSETFQYWSRAPALDF